MSLWVKVKRRCGVPQVAILACVVLFLLYQRGGNNNTTNNSNNNQQKNTYDWTLVEPSVHAPYTVPVSLKLQLPSKYLDDPVLKDMTSCVKQYGFNLDLSNRLPLDRTVPDFRSQKCKAHNFPLDMPKSSVIIIYYNEPVSTLLRNVVGVINRTPPELLGEIILVDDDSTLEELKHLDEHLAQLPAGLIKHVRRNVHNGIVGARIRGAQEATHPIIVFLDSHSEVTTGWLEPLVERIHGDRTRVVVPSLGSINTRSLQMHMGGTWPPTKGSFNWRLTFTIVAADPEKDLMGKDFEIAPVRSPIMPGGLFAMDRRFFFELGAYDPEIFYYGGEHVELSFRVWMCGGKMEQVPCSRIGHIYRDFDRFAVDPQLKTLNTSVFKLMDRNDMRVAEVWMDEYKELFYNSRGLHGQDFGDVSERIALRKNLKCHTFKWYLDKIHPDKFVPDMPPLYYGTLSGPDNNQCLDNMQHDHGGPVGFYGCHGGSTQRWSYGAHSKYLMHDDKCVQTSSRIVLGACDSSPLWKSEDSEKGTMLRVTKDVCLTRGKHGLSIGVCNESPEQMWWVVNNAITDHDRSLCLDVPHVGSRDVSLANCNGGRTQQWEISDGKLHHQSGGLKECLDIAISLQQLQCVKSNPAFQWHMHDYSISPETLPGFCLDRTGGNGDRMLTPCAMGVMGQKWQFADARKK